MANENQNQEQGQTSLTPPDMALVPVRLEYQGESGYHTFAANGRSYSAGDAELYRYIDVFQEDVAALMSQSRFKVISDWYKPSVYVQARTASAPVSEKTKNV